MKKAHLFLGAPREKKYNTSKESSEDLFIGVDRGAVYLLEEGIQPDLAIGDFDSVSEKEFLWIKDNVEKVIKVQSEKDDTDTELAINIIEEKYNPDQFLFYNWIGGRVDHLISLLYLSLQPRFYNIIGKFKFVNHTNTIAFYKPGNYHILKEKDKKYLSFIGMTSVSKLSLKNVKYTLEGEDYDYPMALVSNEFESEEASFSFEEGILAVMQTID